MRNYPFQIRFIFLAFLLNSLLSCSSGENSFRILVFSKTAGFRHIDAIHAGIEAIKKMGKTKGFYVDTTEDAAKFTEENLKNYQAVVFLNVSGDVFNQDERTAFKRYIQAGGGFLAIHGPTDAERNWPWYGRLIGAYFDSHPKVQKGTYVVVDKENKITDSLPSRWERIDEFYNFQQVNPDIHVLLNLDEQTYSGGNMGKNHPAVWYHNFDGGRSFYISMGHSPETYSEPLFLKLLWNGLQYAINWDHPEPLDYSKSIPDENRFSKQILVKNLNEPMQMAFNGLKSIFIAERRGDIVAYDQDTQKSKTVGSIAVDSKYEDGLLGLAIDPKFNQNHWLYVFYTIPSGKEFHVSRFTLNKGLLDPQSEKILLKIPKQVMDGSHTGGGLTFSPDGTGDLYITVGDNTSPRATGYAPIDERDGRINFDAQRSASNTNDLRGKILRIRPEDDGTYSIPDGNLFPIGTSKTRPEIYSMGHRQPWRVYVDAKTGWLFEGEVGPDSQGDSVGLGPQAYDEFNIIKTPGNYGWPYFVGNNRSYWQYNFATGESGEKFEANKPQNHSRYNTGLTQLPAAKPAFIWYPYATSNRFPLMGTGGRTAVGGPVFRKDNYQSATSRFPDYYDGKWFITDFIRCWINVVTLDSSGGYKSIESFMPGTKFNNPLDMQFGPDGRLYILEYGTGWFQQNENSALSCIEYNAGNRLPIVNATADRLSGETPFTVKLSSEGTKDYDYGDRLSYEWRITSKAGEKIKVFNKPNASFTIDKNGTYVATLIVTDDKGGKARKSLTLQAGNALSQISINIENKNKTFFFPNNTINYSIKVSDKEDGTFANKTIDKLYVKEDYFQSYLEFNESKEGLEEDGESGKNIGAQILINGNDCYSCHKMGAKSIGPSFKQIALKYSEDKNIVSTLAKKIIDGGYGNWGKVAMSPHPDLPLDKAKTIARYILSLNRKEELKRSLPAIGNFSTKIPEGKGDMGLFRLEAKYTDNGANGVSPSTSEAEAVLRSAKIDISSADRIFHIMKFKTPNSSRELMFSYGNGSYFGFNKLDLTDISNILLTVEPLVGGVIEIRIDSIKGQLIGRTNRLLSNRNNVDSVEDITVNANVEGIHDIYFISRNIDARDSDILFSLKSIEFIPRE